MTAMKELTKAKNGIYCSPLRLLAVEVHNKLEAQGIPCTLLTGQEKKIRSESKVTSCTIEMSSMEEEYDVAIIVPIYIPNPTRMKFR